MPKADVFHDFGDPTIAFDAEVLEAAGKGRLRVRFANGHVREMAAPRAGARITAGARGYATLPTGPEAGWRFVPSVCPPGA